MTAFIIQHGVYGNLTTKEELASILIGLLIAGLAWGSAYYLAKR